jgi:YjbE family integral membrane protein
MIDLDQVSAFAQVVLVDVTLAGDNAIVVGIVAGRLHGKQRRDAITAGIAIAAVLRILMALVANRLLAIVGLTLAGGILLLWVAWKMFREIVGERHGGKVEESAADAVPKPGSEVRRVLARLVIADLSMSLDNVLAVAGTAAGHFWVLVLGLVLSVALMGVASTLVARLMARAPWIVWLGIAVVGYVAVSLIYRGWLEIGPQVL